LTIDAHDGVGARLLDVPGEHRCVVRLSRAIGLPHRVRDIVGLAIRVLDDDGKGRQDLLFSSVWGDGPVSRHVLAPTGSFTGRPLSTILPYQTSDRRMTLLANGRGRGAVHSLDTVAEMFADGQLTFDLRAVSRGRAPVSFARLRGTAALPADQGEALRFNPYHCEPDLEPAGLLNALRRRAYAASQGGRAHR